MGYTMAEKILMKNTGLSHLAPGDLIMTRPDMCMVHDIYTPFVVQKLDEMKFRRLADPEKAVIFLDHLCPTNQATGDPRHYHKGHELSDRFGIRKLHAGEGISHTLMHEYRYPDVQLTNLLVDKAAMELTCNPSRFDVMLTTSIFGDILSDEAGVATGSVGMLASAAINENGFGLFEPIHGTAPDIAGLGIANPLAAIASAGMLLEIGLGLKEEAAAIDRAINEVLHLGYRTPDIYLEGRGLTKVTTEEMGRLTAEHIHR